GESKFEASSDAGYIQYSKSDKNYLQGKSLLTREFIQRKLFANSETVYIENIWQHDTVGTEQITEHLIRANYYQLDTLLREKLFDGILFEYVESEGSQKYLCTFDKAGKLISKMTIALYHRSGTYANDDGGRSPFWASSEGCIGEDLSVHVDAGGNGKQSYQIHQDGKITRE
ncbi:MAG TPA: hypothetical protein PK798_03820, partial [Flavobacteriales bacterium]|nr:hypothetical protein [Flavobacteriales bacterium]